MQHIAQCCTMLHTVDSRSDNQQSTASFPNNLCIRQHRTSNVSGDMHSHTQTCAHFTTTRSVHKVMASISFQHIHCDHSANRTEYIVTYKQSIQSQPLGHLFYCNFCKLDVQKSLLQNDTVYLSPVCLHYSPRSGHWWHLLITGETSQVTDKGYHLLSWQHLLITGETSQVSQPLDLLTTGECDAVIYWVDNTYWLQVKSHRWHGKCYHILSWQHL